MKLALTMANSELAVDAPITVAKINEVTLGDTAPSAPLEGYVWIDTAGSSPVRKIYDGSKWIPFEEQVMLAALAFV